MTQRYDILTSKTDQNGKRRYTKIGVMFSSREGDGFSIKLEALPLPNERGEVWISAFVPRDRDEGQSQPQRSSGNTRVDLDDEVPF